MFYLVFGLCKASLACGYEAGYGNGVSRTCTTDGNAGYLGGPAVVLGLDVQRLLHDLSLLADLLFSF